MSLPPAIARRGRRGFAVTALAALLAATAAVAAPTAPSTSAPAHRRPAPRAAKAAPTAARSTPKEIAHDARVLEELGAYTRAAETLRKLRGRVAPDADLDLALALDEARAGMLDSARVLLWGPTLGAALVDSMPTDRRHVYGWEREGLFINGRFDGWYWYVARARMEVASALGRWSDAHEAARQAVAARPLAGKEWLALALTAARDGADEEMRLAAGNAARLDPSLPEAQYVAGLLDWRAGRRSEAQERFRAAVGLDSSYREAALALVRAQLPGSRPDTLPAVLLTGVRRAGLLTSPARPKLEEFEQMDSPAAITKRGQPQMPESITAGLGDIELILPVLVDEHGRAVLHDLPWFPQANLPEAAVGAIVASLPEWRFHPATKNGLPQRVWAAVQYTYRPVATKGAAKP
jgi:tetratricopeptide (TPR) repeat protein